MQVYVSNDEGFLGTPEDFDNVVRKITSMIPPKVKKTNVEYAVLISDGCACIFRVDVNKELRCVNGSMLAQIAKGSLKIGFVDINDENIVGNIRDTIQTKNSV